MAKIYLSSTYSDLNTYREAAYRVLRQMRHDVIAMEDYVAIDERPLDACLSDVAQCDIYIGLIAWQYGYIPSKDNPEQLSITELEYRKAIETEKSCLIFLLDDSAPWNPKLMDMATGQGNNGDRIRVFRKELIQNKIVSFFRSHEELSNLLAVAVRNWEISYTATVVSDEIRTIPSTIEFSIQEGDIDTFNADVIALRYAQKSQENDALLTKLGKVGVASDKLRPHIGVYSYADTRKQIVADHVLVVGVAEITNFTYQHIQELSARVLAILAHQASHTEHLAMPLQETVTAYDEIEGFLAQFEGFLDALQREQLPSSLKSISIIDRDTDRVKRLHEIFEQNFGHVEYMSKSRTEGTYYLDIEKLGSIFREYKRSTISIKRTEDAVNIKKFVFVAMPFKKDMDDVFYYGIQQPVHAAGFICERIDQEAFVGEILDQVKEKIETSAVVVAEISEPNPNVYLEVGYAWGRRKPTILLAKVERELPFDIRGHRCLKYERIKDLEKFLREELDALKSKRFF